MSLPYKISVIPSVMMNMAVIIRLHSNITSYMIRYVSNNMIV